MEDAVVTGTQCPGLGKNYMTLRSLESGVRLYGNALRVYAIRGLWKQLRTGGATWEAQDVLPLALRSLAAAEVPLYAVVLVRACVEIAIRCAEQPRSLLDFET